MPVLGGVREVGRRVHGGGGRFLGLGLDVLQRSSGLLEVEALEEESCL